MRLFFEPIGTRAIGWLGYSFVGGRLIPVASTVTSMNGRRAHALRYDNQEDH